MKKSFVILMAAVMAMVTVGCWEKSVGTNTSGLIYRAHFVGLDAILAGTNGTTFQKIWKMPASAELREQTLQKLARAPFEFWKKNLPAGSSDEALLMKPLLDDLIQSESILEVHGPVEKPQTALAIKLSSERVAKWDKNLTQLMAAWNLGKPANQPGVKGWEIRDAKPGGHIQFQRVGDWVLFGFGPANQTLLGSWAAEASKGRPVPALVNKFLTVEADLPRLHTWFPILSEYPFPPVQLSVAGAGPDLKTELLLKYSGKIPFTFEPWKIPQDIISDPLVSFTVARGLAPLLQGFKSVDALGLKPFPNQFCMWGQEHNFPVTYITLPVANATNTINQLAQTAPKILEERLPGHMGDILWNSNRSVLFWTQIPFVAPRIMALDAKDSHFVFGELFPRPSLTNPPPNELFAQFKDRKEVLYYDWELTQVRMPHADQFYQLHDIVDYRKLPSIKSAGQKWVSSVSTNLGNCTTEITLLSPTELKLIRKSQLGFTGFELVGLARWMQSAHFPFEYEQQPRMRISTNAVPNPPRGNSPQTGTGAQKPATGAAEPRKK
jgi:hypothetical protein